MCIRDSSSADLDSNAAHRPAARLGSNRALTVRRNRTTALFVFSTCQYIEKLMKTAFVFLIGVGACAGHEEAPAAQATASTAPVTPSASVSVSASASASATASSAEPKKYGVQGPADDNSPEAQRRAALRDDPNHGIVSLLTTDNAPTEPWGRDDSISPPLRTPHQRTRSGKERRP